MTIIEEWSGIQSLEPDEIGFTISSSLETTVEINVGVQTEALIGFGQGSDRTVAGVGPHGRDETELDWELQAACRSVKGSAELFFSEELADIVTAKRICAECPVIAPCLEGAISRAEPCGVWGGQLFSNGRVLAQKRRRGRPPKVARPEDQLPVVPIPDHLQKLIA